MSNKNLQMNTSIFISLPQSPQKIWDVTFEQSFSDHSLSESKNLELFAKINELESVNYQHLVLATQKKKKLNFAKDTDFYPFQTLWM